MKAFPRPPDQLGMDLRDYFAAAALGGLTNNAESLAAAYEVHPQGVGEVLAATAYQIADAMMAERSQQK